MIKNLVKILNTINEQIGIVSSFLIFFLIILVSLSVVLRYVFSIGFVWLQDLYIWVHAIFILMELLIHSK